MCLSIIASVLAQSVSVEGYTDLAQGNVKFSGNAQRRRRQWLLFHGTFLLESFDVGLLEQCLRAPPRQPEYRQQRTHRDFVMKLPLTRSAIQAALREVWEADEQLEIPKLDLDRLVTERYSRDDWNLKW